MERMEGVVGNIFLKSGVEVIHQRRVKKWTAKRINKARLEFISWARDLWKVDGRGQFDYFSCGSLESLSFYRKWFSTTP